VEEIVKQSHDIEHHKNKIEAKYDRMKENYEARKNECIELKFEVERWKVRGKDPGDPMQDRDKNKTMGIGSRLDCEDSVPTLCALKEKTL
jgi:hypothetical protein